MEVDRGSGSEAVLGDDELVAAVLRGEKRLRPPSITEDVMIGPEPEPETVERTFHVPAGSIKGRVVDATGQGIAGVTVSMTPPPDSVMPWGKERVTDSDGWFAFTDLRAGAYRAAATRDAEGAGERAVEIVVPEDAAAPETEIRLDQQPE